MMWLLKLIEFMDDSIDKVIEFIWCTHDWEFQKKIREQNLRAGYGHDAHIFKCTRCERYKSVELPAEHE